MAKKTREELNKTFKEVMSEFNFKLVERHMTNTDWHWFGIGVPTVKHIKSRAEDLFNHIVSDYLEYYKKVECSSGGLALVITKNGNIKLSFVVESISSADLYEE